MTWFFNQRSYFLRCSMGLAAACLIALSAASAKAQGVGYCQPGQTTCCVHPLVINFVDDLGMDLILRPNEYEANYAAGICPLAPGGALETPRLFQFLSELPEDHPALEIVQPQCVGHTYHDFPVIIGLPGGLEMVLDLKGVQVTRAVCR